MSQRKAVNWTNTLFLVLTPMIGIIGTVLFVTFGLVHWQTWILFGGMLVACGLSITAGYHRLFSHKTYQATWPVRLFFLLFGAATFEGSALEWSTDHRNHHRYTDTDRDPYSVTHGVWHAHIGWLIHLDPSKRCFDNVDDLRRGWLVRMQDRFYILISVIMGLGLPTAIAALWGDALSGLIIAGALRIAIGHHGTFCINSLCHILGKRRYSEQISARDNWVSALVTFGEGYHNYHHQFPLDYRNGVRFWQFDPTKWAVYALSYVGLTSNLRRIPRYRIIQARVETQRRLLATAPQHTTLQPLYQSIMNTIVNIRECEKAYAKSRLKTYRINIKRAQVELQQLFQAWKQIVQIEPQLQA